ncbi:hypothetical protein [Moorena sp. SIO3A2]|uniref:hypothetical protein n=1 Tax=Moorena sp. SIO3A2 TaxID=2607841 RepID=UPI0013BA6621|nr:hypothetical protein [Moorena sp. SIO3A2]NER87300.1 hypothetical protein [Moorena sp. SIO3A2]
MEFLGNNYCDYVRNNLLLDRMEHSPLNRPKDHKIPELLPKLTPLHPANHDRSPILSIQPKGVYY